jgi:hypothetical protein
LRRPAASSSRMTGPYLGPSANSITPAGAMSSASTMTPRTCGSSGQGGDTGYACQILEVWQAFFS